MNLRMPLLKVENVSDTGVHRKHAVLSIVRLLREGIALTFNPSISCLHALDLSLVSERVREACRRCTRIVADASGTK